MSCFSTSEFEWILVMTSWRTQPEFPSEITSTQISYRLHVSLHMCWDNVTVGGAVVLCLYNLPWSPKHPDSVFTLGIHPITDSICSLWGSQWWWIGSAAEPKPPDSAALSLQGRHGVAEWFQLINELHKRWSSTHQLQQDNKVISNTC